MGQKKPTHPPTDEGGCLQQCAWPWARERISKKKTRVGSDRTGEGEGKAGKNSSNEADCARCQGLVHKHIPATSS